MGTGRALVNFLRKARSARVAGADHLAKGKVISSKTTRNNGLVGGKVKTPVSLMVIRVLEEDTGGGARCKLVGTSGGQVRITSTPEDTKVLIRGHNAEQGEVRSRVLKCLGGEDVAKVGGSVKGLDPVGGRNTSLKEK